MNPPGAPGSTAARGAQLSSLWTPRSPAAPQNQRIENDSQVYKPLLVVSRANEGRRSAPRVVASPSDQTSAFLTVTPCDHAEKMLVRLPAPHKAQTEGNSFPPPPASEQTPAVLYVSFMTQYPGDGLKRRPALTRFIQQAGFSCSDAGRVLG